MNNLPKNIIQFDGKEEVKLELPVCDYCEERSNKENPVKEHNEEMVCYDCVAGMLYDKYFPRPKSNESEIHESL